MWFWLVQALFPYCYFKCYFVSILINGPAGINASFIYLKITASQLTDILSSRHKILRKCSVHVYIVVCSPLYDLQSLWCKIQLFQWWWSAGIIPIGLKSKDFIYRVHFSKWLTCYSLDSKYSLAPFHRMQHPRAFNSIGLMVVTWHCVWKSHNVLHYNDNPLVD